MRKFSYLFAALLMSVLSLTGRAGTTVEDFSLFSLSGLDLQCPTGWSYINGASGTALLSNNAMPGESGIFFGTSSTYRKTGYLVTEAKAGTISLEVAILSPNAAAAGSASVSVSTMDGASGPVGTELKKWTYDNGLSNALCTLVTVEVELPADGYIGINGNNVCIHKYTNTFAGGEGGGGGSTVSDVQDFNTITEPTTSLASANGWPEGWYTVGTSFSITTQTSGGIDNSPCILTYSANAPTHNLNDYYVVTFVKKGKVTIDVKGYNSSAITNQDNFFRIKRMNKADDSFTFTPGEIIGNNISPLSSGGINADGFITLEWDIPEDMWIGISCAGSRYDNFTNIYEVGGGGTVVTDETSFDGLTGATATELKPNLPEGWYISTPKNYSYYMDSGHLRAGTPDNATDSYLITYAHKGTVKIYVTATSSAYVDDDRAWFSLYNMNKTGENTFSAGDLIQKYNTLKAGNAEMSYWSSLGGLTFNAVPITFEIAEDGWIGINTANAFIAKYENIYEVAAASNTVSGTVKDHDGNPIVGATVKLTGQEDVTTAEDGTFTFKNVPSAELSLRVTAPGYVNFAETLNVTGDVTKDVVLEQQVSTINFYFMTSTSNVNIRNVNVTLYDGDTPVPGNENIVGYDGTFDIDYVGEVRQEEHFVYPVTIKGALDPDKVYTLKASAPGYDDYSNSIYCVEKYNQVYFTLGKSVVKSQYLTPKKIKFTATVVNTESEYIKNATITLKYGNNTRTARFVEADLNYVISDIPAPELSANTVVASCVVPGMHPIADQTIDFDGENIEVEFIAVPYEATVIKGNVTRANDENIVIAGASVTLLDGEEKVEETVTDAEGAYKFTLNGAVKESYTITVTAPYYADYSAEITPEEEATNSVNVAMEPVMYGFTATVADENSVAIEGAKVTLGGKELTTDEHGNFVGSVWAGDVAGGKSIEVVASAEGYDPETFELTYAEGETEASHAFILKLTQYSLTVTVTEDINYETLPDAIVKVFDADGAEQTVVNEGNGVFGANWTSKTVPAGELTVTVMCEGYDSKSETFDFSSDKDVSIDVELTEHLYSLTVTVLNSNDNDAPVLDATVVITCEELEEVREEADPQGDGTYVFQAGAVSAKGLTLIATITAPGLENPVSFNFNFDDGNVDKTVKIAVSGVNAVFAGEKGAKNLAGKIYVNGDAEIFSIDGKLVRVVRTQGVEEIEGLQPGLYIVAGQKMIVK